MKTRHATFVLLSSILSAPTLLNSCMSFRPLSTRLDVHHFDANANANHSHDDIVINSFIQATYLHINNSSANGTALEDSFTSFMGSGADISALPEVLKPTSFDVTATSYVYCIGGSCDQREFFGSAEILIEPDHYRISIRNLSVKTADNAMHLTGQILQYTNTDKIEPPSEASVTLTTPSSIIQLDRKSTLHVNQVQVRQNIPNGIFILFNEKQGMYLDGRMQ